MRRSLRRRSRAAQAPGVTPGQVLANPLPRYDMDFPGCGCSSGVEHDLAKVGVEGSNPFARSKIFKQMRHLRDASPAARLPKSYKRFINGFRRVRTRRTGDASWTPTGRQLKVTALEGGSVLAWDSGQPGNTASEISAIAARHGFCKSLNIPQETEANFEREQPCSHDSCSQDRSVGIHFGNITRCNRD